MKTLYRKMTEWFDRGFSQQEGVGFLPFVIIVATLVAYWPVREHGFVRWDEQLYVMENPFLTDPDGLRKSWTTLEKTERQYYPLLLTTYWLQYQLWGDNPAGYHAVNLWFHLCNSVLVLFLLRVLGTGRWVAGVGALLFALHPIQAESVAWVAELKNLQSGFFYLAAFLFYWLHRAHHPVAYDVSGGRVVRTPATGGAAQGWAAYGAVLFFYACALLSKTSTVTLPLSLFLFDWLLASRAGSRRHPQWWRGSLARVVPMLAMGIIPSLIAVSLEDGPAPEAIPPLGLRPLIAAAAIWFYVGKLVLPITLVPIYPRWEVGAGQWWLWAAAAGLAVTLMVVWHWRDRLGGLVLWGLGHFVASLSPLLGFIPFGYLDHSFVADHFTYIASIGFFLVVAVFAERICQGIPAAFGSQPARRWIMTGVVCALLVGLAGLTRSQARVWRDPITFWSYVASENPRSSNVHNNLGNAYLRNDNLEEAQVHYGQALRIQPNSSIAHHNLGLALSKQGHLDEAIEEYRQAIYYQPRYWLAHANLALAYAQQGRFDEAAISAERARESAIARGQTDAAAELEGLIKQYRSKRSG